MALTPVEIRHVKPGRTFVGGYQRAAVDELLGAVDQVGALAPDLLEAVRDLEQQPFGGSTPVTAQRGALQLDMPDFDGGDAHYPSLSRTELTILAPRMSVKTATIGDRSSGPNGGRKRRKTRRYGSQTS